MSDIEDLKEQIQTLIDMDRRSGSMEVFTPIYIARMLNVPLEEVEAALRP